MKEYDLIDILLIGGQFLCFIVFGFAVFSIKKSIEKQKRQKQQDKEINQLTES